MSNQDYETFLVRFTQRQKCKLYCEVTLKFLIDLAAVVGRFFQTLFLPSYTDLVFVNTSVKSYIVGFIESMSKFVKINNFQSHPEAETRSPFKDQQSRRVVVIQDEIQTFLAY